MIAGAAGAAAIERTSVALPVPEVFEAEIVTLFVPAAAGVPEISPVATLFVRPEGRFEAP